MGDTKWNRCPRYGRSRQSGPRPTSYGLLGQNRYFNAQRYSLHLHTCRQAIYCIIIEMT